MHAFIYLILNVSALNVWGFFQVIVHIKMSFFFRVSYNKRQINPDLYKNEGVHKDKIQTYIVKL